MKTILKSKTKKVEISTDGPFTIIGEKINPTGRKKLAAALQEGNLDYVRDLAKKQIEAGADVLDVNVGMAGTDDVDYLPAIVKMLAEEFDIPLCLDSPNPKALAAALPLVQGRALVNSVNGEEKSLAAVLPIVKEYGTAVIGLTIGEGGISNDPQKRLAAAGKIIERAAQIGIPLEDIIIDPLVMTVGADSSAGLVTLTTIELVRKEFGVNINLGASNVSFGLPERDVINQAFLALAISAGATCAITDPIKYTLAIRAIDLLRGRDSYGMRYLKYYRAHAQEKTA
ncbi:MAG: dihydropteroate synthase [Chloroflexota bacterium]|nr:dihydropteroate synthase [Chloroflexota bacterium]MBI5704019.1 dihydropteroate synthase [Chloroflexota bacterium]